MELTKKIEKQKEYTSSYDNKYTFQKVKPSVWVKVMQSTNQLTDLVKLYEGIFENIVVKPQMTMDDFENDGYGGYGEMEEVAQAALRFQQGN